ncbi:Mucin-desulfating sulfatase [Planctomycetales bacterium 10988]|nr:Mucin-desulfating sulfatase [Planctomycetales bacterium 10988]
MVRSLLLAVVLLGWLGAPSLQAADSPPNILFFMSDDQRNDTLGCAGHPIVKTPQLDRLAENGVRFENAFVSHSICWVSRMTLLTGLTARSFGRTDRPDSAKPEVSKVLYPDRLHKAGYRTGFYGKWHTKFPEDFKPEDHFDEFEAIHRNPYLKEQADGTMRHETELIGDRAEAFLDKQPSDKPFCLTLWFNAAHAEDRDKEPGSGHYPWTKATDGMYEDVAMPEPKLNDPAIFENHPDFLKTSINRERYFWRWDTPEKYETNLRAYFRLLTGIDNVVGRVVKKLEEQGLADNTIIVYIGDNGYFMGNRGFAGKWLHYDESLRVPLIIYDPRQPKEDRGRVLSELAVNFDLTPTFLDWAGLKIPKSYQGKSLKPLLEGSSEKWRNDFFCEHVTLAPKITWEGVRGKRYKYARYFDQEPVYEFFHDLNSDPDELVNLAESPEYAELLEKYRKRCDKLVKKYGGPLGPIEDRVSTLYPREKREQVNKKKRQ